MQAASAAHVPACRLLGQLYGLSSNSFSTLSDRERISKSPSSSSSSHVSNEVPLFSTCSAPSTPLAYCISWSEKTLMAFISGVVYVFLIDCITFLFLSCGCLQDGSRRNCFFMVSVLSVRISSHNDFLSVADIHTWSRRFCDAHALHVIPYGVCHIHLRVVLHLLYARCCVVAEFILVERHNEAVCLCRFNSLILVVYENILLIFRRIEICINRDLCVIHHNLNINEVFPENECQTRNHLTAIELI